MAGQIIWYTMIRSKILVRTGVMEIGLKLACSLGADILGTGVMTARFHCCGVVEVAMDRLKRRVAGL